MMGDVDVDMESARMDLGDDHDSTLRPSSINVLPLHPVSRPSFAWKEMESRIVK
jgi:hypothetical protein